MGNLKNIDFERCTSGIDFETWNRDLLRSLNFTAERVGKNDSGIDIIAQTKYKGKVFRFYIQCKYYNRPVGKAPIQEIFSGTAFHKDYGRPVVIINNTMTYLWQIQEQKLRYITQILTGKHIARSCEDVDETVLSAAQFKAAATDNPMVAQKMELENRVTELKILRGAWSNEQLSLERKINSIYPGQIKRYEKEIVQISEDIKLLNQSAGSDFSIVLDGKRYTERSEAGEAFGLLYRMIKEGAKDDSEEFEIGAYRSFPLYLSIGFISRLTLRHNHHYTTEVGTSASGAITRIENLAERIPSYLADAQRELEETQKQLAVAQQQVGQPFLYEGELSEKAAQLTEINTKLEFDSLQESEVILDENGQRSDGEEDWDSERVPACASAEV